MKNILLYFFIFCAGSAVSVVVFLFIKEIGFLELLKEVNKNYASALSAIFGFATLMVAIVMSISLFQNKKSLDINTAALNLQKNEFKIRNRPLVDIVEARFGGSLKSAEGEAFPKTVEIALVNRTDILATNFLAVCNIKINDKVVKKTKIDIGSLTQGTKWQGDIFLTQQIYEEATQLSNKFSIEFSSTYSGLLGEKPDEYSTSFTINYFSENNDFRFANKVLR